MHVLEVDCLHYIHSANMGVHKLWLCHADSREACSFSSLELALFSELQVAYAVASISHPWVDSTD